jgi:hypothetical protein
MSKDVDDDRLRGIRQIAHYTRESYRQAQYRIDRGNYPVKRVGKIVESTKSAIDKARAPKTAQ